MDKKTPLYDVHLALGGKIVEFGGYLLPVQYSGLIAEHRAVRTACGLFDVSHMGEILVKGPGALASVNHLLTNDFSGMYDGQARYGMMCLENGGIIDDLIVYKRDDEQYLLVVNASNRDKDFAWIRSHVSGDCVAEDISDSVALLALQGPNAPAVLEKLTDSEIPEKGYSAKWNGVVAAVKAVISRTGYTGEDGFELYCASEDATALWNAVLEAGKDLGILPCGLGARDTLRLEASMPLYGHELTEEINPYEAGLGFFVKLAKEDFIGKAALEAAKENLSRKRVGLEMTGRGIAREHCPVMQGGREVGMVSSGTHCPYLGKAFAMAYVEKSLSEPGQTLTVDVRGRPVEAVVVKIPFYKRNY